MASTLIKASSGMTAFSSDTSSARSDGVPVGKTQRIALSMSGGDMLARRRP